MVDHLLLPFSRQFAAMINTEVEYVVHAAFCLSLSHILESFNGAFHVAGVRVSLECRKPDLGEHVCDAVDRLPEDSTSFIVLVRDGVDINGEECFRGSVTRCRAAMAHKAYGDDPTAAPHVVGRGDGVSPRTRQQRRPAAENHVEMFLGKVPLNAAQQMKQDGIFVLILTRALLENLAIYDNASKTNISNAAAIPTAVVEVPVGDSQKYKGTYEISVNMEVFPRELKLARLIAEFGTGRSPVVDETDGALPTLVATDVRQLALALARRPSVGADVDLAVVPNVRPEAPGAGAFRGTHRRSGRSEHGRNGGPAPLRQYQGGRGWDEGHSRNILRKYRQGGVGRHGIFRYFAASIAVRCEAASQPCPPLIFGGG